MNVSSDIYYTEHPKCRPTISANRHVLTALYVQFFFLLTYICPNFGWAGNYQIHTLVPVKKKPQGLPRDLSKYAFPASFHVRPVKKSV